jgi:hypothetical protein
MVHLTHFSLVPVICMWALYDMYQNDEVMTDKLVDRYTLNPKYQKTAENPHLEYELFSDRSFRLWPNYKYNEIGAMIPTEKQETINFDRLKKLLLSSDTELNRKEFDTFVSTMEPKFLDKKVDMIGNRIQMASFPRSGKSFLRKLIEQITGVITGSDFHIREVLNLQH